MPVPSPGPPHSSGSWAVPVRIGARSEDLRVEGIRIQACVPASVAGKLRERALSEGRSVSSLIAYLLERGLVDIPTVAAGRES